MPDKRFWVFVFLVTFGVAGCVTVDIPEQVTLFPTGRPFVISGTAAVEYVDGEPCEVWVGDNGVTYHLFQDPRLDNETFDRITAPAVRSRLEIAGRSDLEVICQIGTIVEVQDVLEIAE